MIERTNSILPRALLTDQLREKSRRRRDRQERLAKASTARPRRNDILPRLELSDIRIADLRPSPRKVRKLDPVHVREVASSISALGFCVPLLVGRDNEIINGEVSYEAAKQMSLDRLPCVRIGHLSLEEQRVLRLAVNRLAEKGEWDLDELKIEFEELILSDAPIEIIGFSPAEIDQVILGEAADGLEQGPLEPDPAHCGRQGWRCLPTRSASHRLRRRDRSRGSCSIDGRRRAGPPRPDRRALQREDRRPRHGRRPSRVRDGLRRNDRRRVPRLQ